MKSIDISLLKEILKMAAPPTTGRDGRDAQPEKDNQGFAVMAVNIANIQRDVSTIQGDIKDIKEKHVTTSEFNEHCNTQLTGFADHEKRVRILEASMWKWIGTSSAIAAIISMGVMFASRLIK